jgi:hypothetical protein
LAHYPDAIGQRQNEAVNYGMQQAACPRCGSSAEVRTVAELFDMLNGMQDQAMQQAQQGWQQGPYAGGQQGPYSGQGDPGSYGPNPQGPPGSYGPDPQGAPGSYGPDPQGAPGSYGPNPQGAPGSYGPNPQGPPPPQAPQGGQGYTYAGGYSDSGRAGQPNTYRSSSDSEFTGDIGQDIANAVLGGAGRFLGRAIGKKVQQTLQDRVIPAMQAKAAQAQQRQQQARDDQGMIIQRYPDLRGCLRDQVVFLEGGTKTVPIAEISMPVTLANADALVSRLRAP